MPAFVGIILALFMFNSLAYAASCSDAKDRCMKTASTVRGAQGINPTSKCVSSYDQCMKTGSWGPKHGLTKQ